MTAAEALAFVKRQGIVLVSAKGPFPRLTEVVIGESIRGSWWGHPRSHQIFAVLQVVCNSKDILMCRLVNGKVTLVHRRLWPALVRAAKRFHPDQLAKVSQEHTESGYHRNKVIRFPKWVPADIKRQANELSEEEAVEALGSLIATTRPVRRKSHK